ncbi:class I SAM-dependent methyltransferase [Streptomyces morookaense]|uniref:class I SAM-dependent methyltransferase n=1 Tax=Streptomyces morookaense TaxID=1970 RepID=UPI0033E63951
MARRRALPYGIDGPWQLAALAAGAVLAALLAVVARLCAAPLVVALAPAAAAAGLAGCTVTFLHASLRGKFVVWRRLADALGLSGDETVLDLGCGSGAVMMLLGRRLPGGRAVGIDLWRQRDQWRSGPRVLRENAAVEGVRARTMLCTADMTALPFADCCFDLVVTSMAVHNVRPVARRRTVLAEAVRVLRPGGRLVMVDIWARGRAEALASLGMCAVDRRGAGPVMWWCGPLVRTAVITAVKPR